MADHRDQKRVLQYMARFPEGLTIEELASKMRVELQWARSRIYALKRVGLLVKTDEKRGFPKPSHVYVTHRHAQQKTAAPEGTAELPNGDGVAVQSDGLGDESNNRPGPQDGGHGEQLIRPQEFGAEDQCPNHNRSACNSGDTEPHACLP